jgi:hypothetical protein
MIFAEVEGVPNQNILLCLAAEDVEKSQHTGCEKNIALRATLTVLHFLFGKI